MADDEASEANRRIAGLLDGSEPGFAADRRALAADWRAVGDDLRAGMRRVIEEQDQRDDWSRYIDGNHWFGQPPPPAQPGWADYANAVLGGIVFAALLLGLIIAVAVAVTS